MGKHSRCVIGICDNNMQYLELPKKHSNVKWDIILHKLPKHGAVKAAGRKQLIQESHHAFATTYLFG